MTPECQIIAGIYWMRRPLPASVEVSSANTDRPGKVTFSGDAGLLEKSLHLSVAWAEETEGLLPD